MADSRNAVSSVKPVHLYSHLPGILAGYPAIIYLILAGLSLPYGLEGKWAERCRLLTEDTIFWIGLFVAVTWYIAYSFNLPKKRFFLVFGLMGTFLGIPIVLELTTDFRMFHWLGSKLGALRPRASTGAWFVGALTFGIIWLANFIWSRTHMRVTIDASGLTIHRVGGKGERYDLIGLKTENEPMDYLESFLAGIGSLSLKSRLNKPIFTLKRVVGLYRMPLLPWRKGKLARIEEILSFQGKILSIDSEQQLDMAEMADAASDDDLGDDESPEDHEIDGTSGDGDHAIESPDSPDIK